MTPNINYKNTGWDSIDIYGKINDLAYLCNEKNLLSYYEFKTSALNKVFKLNFPDMEYIAKISPIWNKNGLLREVNSYKKIKENSTIRIPEIILYKSSENHIFPNHEILILEYIPGKLITPIDLDQKKTHKEISQIYNQIHKIPMNNYGWLNENFNGMHQNWLDFLINIDNIELTLKKKGIKNEEYNWLVKEFSEQEDIHNYEPSLLHGDFRKENFIVGSLGIVPIDFQNCFAGHYLYDFGIGLFFYPNLLSFLKYYNIDIKNIKQLGMLILYAMRHAISTLGNRIVINNQALIRYSKNRFHQLEKMYLNMLPKK
jgi:fructosamine-3-kinase